MYLGCTIRGSTILLIWSVLHLNTALLHWNATPHSKPANRWEPLLVLIKWNSDLSTLGCPLRTKVWSSTFSFALELALGVNNSRKNFWNFWLRYPSAPHCQRFPPYFMFYGTRNLWRHECEGYKIRKILKFFSWVIQAKGQLWWKGKGLTPNFCSWGTHIVNHWKWKYNPFENLRKVILNEL